MLFGLKNDGGIELHLDEDERELIFNALRHYSAYSDDNAYIIEQMPKICEIMNVLE
jgi:hypothetical protein